MEELTRKEALFDAKEAGGKDSDQCTLILAVGDIARYFAKSGLSALDRDQYGLYMMNRENLLDSKKVMMNNPEIQNLIQILGLEQDKEYDNESIKSLRYRHLMIIINQDWDIGRDGRYSKGLLINFFHSFWPSLLRINPSFLEDFVIPIAEATHRENGSVIPFYSMQESESWRESNPNSSSNYNIEYFRGLAFRKADEYFRDIESHKRYFVWEDEEDDAAIKLAFSNNTEDRKNWLRRFEQGAYLDQKEKLLKFRDFVNKEVILYPMANHQRMIPSMVDGLKLYQRKILFSCLKLNLVGMLMVRNLSVRVIENAAYQDGIECLQNNIIGMAQDFVGSNNINLLKPESYFGSRSHGGKYNAGEFGYTRLSPITRYLFHKDDDVLLDYLKDKGKSIEPTWYIPVIPTVLVNGSQGICTEFSTSIPKYNPRDIIANIRRLLNGEPMKPMNPWYKGFKGIIEKSATKKGSYTCSGLIELINETTLLITELPVRKWTDDYMKWLDTKKIGYKKAVETFIHIEVFLPSEEEMAKVKQEGLLKKFNLTTTINTSNMHLFDSNGVIKKYNSVEEIMEEFYHLRLALYEKRKKALVENLELEVLTLDNENLCAERDQMIIKVDELKNTPSRSMWIQDLDALDRQLDELEKAR